MQGFPMNINFLSVRAAALAALAAAFVIGGCAGKEERLGPSRAYEESTAKTEAPKCPAGYVLQCEAKKVGRIRFGRIGNQNLDSCACELYQGMPTQSPLPGIQ
jgi:hypothetical protein